MRYWVAPLALLIDPNAASLACNHLIHSVIVAINSPISSTMASLYLGDASEHVDFCVVSTFGSQILVRRRRAPPYKRTRHIIRKLFRIIFLRLFHSWDASPLNGVVELWRSSLITCIIITMNIHSGLLEELETSQSTFSLEFFWLFCCCELKFSLFTSIFDDCWRQSARTQSTWLLSALTATIDTFLPINNAKIRQKLVNKIRRDVRTMKI